MEFFPLWTPRRCLSPSKEIELSPFTGAEGVSVGTLGASRRLCNSGQRRREREGEAIEGEREDSVPAIAWRDDTISHQQREANKARVYPR